MLKIHHLAEVHQVHQVGDAAATRIQANVRPDAEAGFFAGDREKLSQQFAKLKLARNSRFTEKMVIFHTLW